MGAHIEVRNTSEYTIYSKTPEDFVNDYSVFGGYMANCLEIEMLTTYGITMDGKVSSNSKLKVKHDPRDVVFYVDENQQLQKMPREQVSTASIMQGLRNGQQFLLPSVDPDGQLNFSNPTVLKSLHYQGEERLLALSDRQQRHAMDELAHIQEPTFWQRLADGVLKWFGMRNEACQTYEETCLQMLGVLQGIRKDHILMSNTDLSQPRFAQSEQKDAHQADPQNQRTTHLHMGAATFEQMLNQIMQDGATPLPVRFVDQQKWADHNILLARAMYEPTRALLEHAAKTGNPTDFLQSQKTVFLRLMDDMNRYIQENANPKDLDAVFTADPQVYPESPELMKETFEILIRVDNFAANACQVYQQNLDSEIQKSVEQPQMENSKQNPEHQQQVQPQMQPGA